MTNAAVNSTVFTPSAAVAAVSKTQKAAQTAPGFGDVLNNASRNMNQPKQTQASKGETSRTKVNAKTHDVSEQKETAKPEDIEKLDNADLAEEPIDEETVRKTSEVLMQIMEQIQEILGVSDEELLSGMERIGMQPLDLLNPDNMAQLVAAVSGEDSTISLVANEELYASLQELTGMVETQVKGLLEETGLSSEEFDLILQRLQELENAMTQTSEAGDAEQAPVENFMDVQEDVAAVSQPEAEETVPVIVSEDKTETDNQNVTVQQSADEHTEEMADIAARADKASQDKKEDAEPRDFGQHNNPAQNFQNHLEAMTEITAEAKAESYTSASTENILRQLADFVKIMRNDDLTEMEMQLHPASLGTVNVSLSTKGGVVTAEFITQNEAVKNAVEAQAVQLRANLEEQGVKIEAIEVSVASHQMEKNLDKDGQEQRRSEQEQKMQGVHGIRRNSINFNSFEDGDELLDEMQGADDATRIAMEMMAINGSSMDLLA